MGETTMGGATSAEWREAIARGWSNDGKVWRRKGWVIFKHGPRWNVLRPTTRHEHSADTGMRASGVQPRSLLDAVIWADGLILSAEHHPDWYPDTVRMSSVETEKGDDE